MEQSFTLADGPMREELSSLRVFANTLPFLYHKWPIFQEKNYCCLVVNNYN